MIKHIVMWNIKGDSSVEKLANSLRVKRLFEGMAGAIPGMKKIEIGIDISRIDYACDVVLYSEFESQEALEGYASHPEHLRVREQLADVRTSRHQVDYLPAGPAASDRAALAAGQELGA
ncbi:MULTISPECIES: Dabb family protein [Pseudomonadaceae]|uniref:Dabb family protein n=1 Tax=Stutzerimonas xanthomarina TaxID=271420 RepID=A0A3R8U083_9GAMM|nr:MULTISPECIES: Dabb family protein [Pseudomonadaceae]MDB1107854.1 Dabb family protein [Pseudomonas extremaustralis]RRV03599.1 Dabb family protein [Stutzerimonas xanthomarina]RZO10704.1 Dabb family protein [Pseudomonas moorei]WQN29913.1 Dabb family protein [Stutzerimonas stutzeri]